LIIYKIGVKVAVINIENPHLRGFIRKKLGFPRYNSLLYDYMVEEALVRMQYVLDLTPEEFLEDLENLNSSLNKISFVNTNDSWMGQYVPSTKEIQFNNGYFNDLFKTLSSFEYSNKLFETVVHELLHTMQYDKNGHNRAEVYNKNVKNRGRAIYEICTEGIAVKCTYARSYSDMENNEIPVGDGYSQELFAIPLLAATFGVSEKTILKYGVRERYKLVEACNKNIGNSPKTEDFISRIEDKLELIHSIFYPDNNQKKFKKMSYEQKQIEAHKAYKELISICGEVLSERVQNLPTSYDKDSIVQLLYDYKKIMDTVKNENKKYGAYFGQITSQEEFKMFTLDPNYSYCKSAIEILKELGKAKNRHLMISSPEIINSIKNKDFDICVRYGLHEPNDMTISSIYTAQGFLDDIAHEDYNDYYSWDNSTFINYIYNRVPSPRAPVTINPDLVKNASFEYDYYIKMNDLRIALLANKDKYHMNAQNLLTDFLSFKENIPKNYYNRFTRTIPQYDNSSESLSPRARMKRSYNSQKDQVFLADIIADRFLKTAFNSYNMPTNLEDEQSRILQSILTSTVQQYGQDNAKYILKEILLNDYYPNMSNETDRNKLAILGRKQITDITMKPLLQEMLNTRKIIPEKRNALQYAVALTEGKYPQTISERLAILFENYKKEKTISDSLFTRDGNASSEFRKEFRSPKDMDDMLGLICDAYSSQNYLMPNRTSSIQQVLNDGGPDYFRENIIKAMLHDDYSGLYNPEHRQVLSQTPLSHLIKEISVPFINEAVQINYYNGKNNNHQASKLFISPNLRYSSSNNYSTSSGVPGSNYNLSTTPSPSIGINSNALVNPEDLRMMASNPKVLGQISQKFNLVKKILEPDNSTHSHETSSTEKKAHEDDSTGKNYHENNSSGKDYHEDDYK